MAEKRTKSEKEQRQADCLDKKTEGRPEIETSKTTVKKDVPKAA